MGSLARVLFTGEGEGGGGGFKSGAGDDSPVVGSGQEVEGCEAGRCCTLLLGQAIAGKENGEGGGSDDAFLCNGERKGVGRFGAVSTWREERGGQHALSKGRGVWRWQGCGGGSWLAMRCAGAGEEGGPVGVGRSWSVALGRAIENSNFLIYSN
jgi:hypothetical protein